MKTDKIKALFLRENLFANIVSPLNQEHYVNDSVVNSLFKDILEIYDATRVYLFIYNFESQIQELKYEVYSVNNSYQLERREIALNDTLFLNDMMQNREPLIIDNIEEYRAENIDKYNGLNVQEVNSLAIVPVIYNDITIGYIRVEIAVENREWSEQDLTMLYLISKLVSCSIAAGDESARAKERAEQSDKLKMSFLANMSHEVRTPLNAIVGFSELLKHTEDPDELQEYINIIKSNNRLLLRLVNDILDMASLETGIIDLIPEQYDIARSVTELCLTTSESVQGDVEVRVESTLKKCVITIDRNRVEQIWSNFISNSIKHTYTGEITLGLEYENEGVKIYVRDTGDGIDDSKKHLVFQSFEKLDTFTQGTGLGLAICKSITDALQGKIGFESIKGEGSTFWAWFPCKAEEIERIVTTKKEDMLETSQAAVNTAPKRSYKLLVAEDNDSNFMLLKAILRDQELIRAYNGREAVLKIEVEQFDAVLMDIKMPIMNGLEATQAIRMFNKTTPIIALTANAFDSDRKLALDSGCDDFLSKPILKGQILAALEKWCK